MRASSLARLASILRLADPSERLRINAAIKPLIAALNDFDAQVRVEAADALGLIRDDVPAVEPLAVVLKKDSEPRVRTAAATALGLVGNHEAVEVLIAALRDPDRQVRSYAADALGNSRDKLAVGTPDRQFE